MYGKIRSRSVGYRPINIPSCPSRPTKYTPLYNLQGGINTALPSHQIANSDLSDAYNVEYTSWGLKTRLGKEKYNSVEITGVTSIRGLQSSYGTGSRVLLAAGDDGAVYKDDGLGTFSSLKSGLTADSWYWFNDFKTYTFFGNGNGYFYRWDGSNVDTMTTAPEDVVGCVNCESRLFAWKDNSSLLYFCGLNDETDWSLASEYSGYLVVPSVKGDKIIACAKQGRSIVVFKSKSIWRYTLYGLPRTWVRELISDSLGIAGKYALDSIESLIYFVGDDSRVYEMAASPKLISGKIESPDTSRWGLPTDMNQSKRSETVVKYMPASRTVRVIYNDLSATANYPSVYADYGLSGKTWLRGNMSAYNMAICDGNDDTGDMFIGSPTSGYIYKINTGTNDDGTAIDAYVKTKDFDFGIADAKKILNTAYTAFYSSGNWNAVVTHYVDFAQTGTSSNVSLSGGGALWDTAIWDTDVFSVEGLVKGRVDLGNVSGYFSSLKIGNNTLDQYFELRGIGYRCQYQSII